MRYALTPTRHPRRCSRPEQIAARGWWKRWGWCTCSVQPCWYSPHTVSLSVACALGVSLTPSLNLAAFRSRPNTKGSCFSCVFRVSRNCSVSYSPVSNLFLALEGVSSSACVSQVLLLLLQNCDEHNLAVSGCATGVRPKWRLQRQWYPRFGARLAHPAHLERYQHVRETSCTCAGGVVCESFAFLV